MFLTSAPRLHGASTTMTPATRSRTARQAARPQASVQGKGHVREEPRRRSPEERSEADQASTSSRRVLLGGAAGGLLGAGCSCVCRPGSAQAAADPVCQQCAGTGAIPCPLCNGSGLFATGFGDVADEIECPNCEGLGTLKCTRCLGTGLASTAGLLRGPAVTEGRLRVRGDGSIEILDCDYFPATRGKKNCKAGWGGDNRLTEELVQTAPRGGLVKRADLQL